MSVQKLRLRQGWSQQQLADASGLSVRTIQRIEAGYPASAESLKSIAAVFQVDFSTLQKETAMDTQPDAVPALERQEAEAFAYVRKLRGFYLHAIKYVVVVLLLAVINLIFTPHKPWVLWVVFGWGIGLASHAFAVFRPDWAFGPQWEKRQVERRLGRPL